MYFNIVFVYFKILYDIYW